MTRPSTPNEYYPNRHVKKIYVKRCCNGCDREIGDATEDELNAAVAGLPLPDVRDECGCVK